MKKEAVMASEALKIVPDSVHESFQERRKAFGLLQNTAKFIRDSIKKAEDKNGTLEELLSTSKWFKEEGE